MAKYIPHEKMTVQQIQAEIDWYRLLDEKYVANTQTSLFDSQIAESPRRPVPPKVPDQYMVAECTYSDRLNGRHGQTLVWGTKGEYQA